MSQLWVRREAFGGVIADTHSYNTRLINHAAFAALRSHANGGPSAPEALLADLSSLGLDVRRNGLRIVDPEPAPRTTTVSAPFIFWMELTAFCPLSCEHCFLAPDQRGTSSLDLPLVLRLLNELHESGVFRLTFTGGEALYYPHIEEVVHRAAELGFGTRLFTGGCIGRRQQSLLAELPLDWIFLSIDGGAASHEALRGPRTYRRVVQCLESLADAGVTSRVTISTTLDNVNRHEMPELFELAAKAGVRSMLFRPLMEYQWSSFDAPRGFRDKHVLLDALRDVVSLSTLWGVEVQLNKTPVMPIERTVLLEDSPDNLSLISAISETPSGDCPGGHVVGGVRADGSVVPCGFIPMDYRSDRDNSVNSRSFEWLWEHSQNLKSLRGLVPSVPCRSCGHYSRCNGGCPANSLLHGQSLGSLDPHCVIHETVLGPAIAPGQDEDVDRWVESVAGHEYATARWQDSSVPEVSRSLIVSKCGWSGA